MYNEKEYVFKTIEIAKYALKEITSNYEIVIVDDASTDGSGQLTDEIAKADNKIKVIHHFKNRKLGGALKTGFSNASKDINVYTDIDLPFDLFALKNVIPLISESDIIKGYRIGSRESLLRTVYSKIYNFLINFIFGIKIRDVNFALMIFRREVLRNIELRSEGSFINAEFLAKARRIGYSIREVAVTYQPRTYGVSRLSSIPVIFKILFEMVKFYPEIKLLSQKKVTYNKLKVFYKNATLKAKIYNFLRFKTCPFTIITKFIPPEGGVADLGCGTGIFLNLLRMEYNNHSLLGFEWDKRKVKIATESLNGNHNIRFEVIDVTNNNFNLPQTKCITLIDILYYLKLNEKRKLLRKCFETLDNNSVLIVKDINRTWGLKFLWAFIQEFVVIKILHFTTARGLYFENKEKCTNLLKESGFSVKVFAIDRGYLYPHILYVCTK